MSKSLQLPIAGVLLCATLRLVIILNDDKRQRHDRPNSCSNKMLMVRKHNTFDIILPHRSYTGWSPNNWGTLAVTEHLNFEIHFNSGGSLFQKTGPRCLNAFQPISDLICSSTILFCSWLYVVCRSQFTTGTKSFCRLLHDSEYTDLCNWKQKCKHLSSDI